MENLVPDIFIQSNDSQKRCYCGVEIDGIQSQALCQWPHKKITYYEEMTFSGMSREKVKSIYDKAFQQWADVSGLEVKRVDNIKDANVYARKGWIDLPGFILALSDLPCGATEKSQMSQKFDSSENWSEKFFLEVACHEIGHALGLPHLGSNTIMAAMGTGKYTKPQPKDIEEIQKRYGKPNPTPVPPTPVPPTPVPPTPVPPTPSNKELKLDGDMLEIKVTPENSTFTFNFEVPSTGFLKWGKTKVFIKTQGSLDTTMKILKNGKEIERRDDGFIAKNAGIETTLYGGNYIVVVEVKDKVNDVFFINAVSKN